MDERIEAFLKDVVDLEGVDFEHRPRGRPRLPRGL